MRGKSLRVLPLIACIGVAGIAGNAYATPISYQFSVVAVSGSLTGQTSTGYLTYDSSSIIPDGANTSADLLVALDFTWNTIRYDQTTANTGAIFFDSAGAPTAVIFGNNCSASGCGVSAREENWSVAWFFGSYNDNATAFTYSTPSDGGNYEGSVSLAKAAVPAPAPLGLLSAALFALGFMRARSAA